MFDCKRSGRMQMLVSQHELSLLKEVVWPVLWAPSYSRAVFAENRTADLRAPKRTLEEGRVELQS